MRRKMEAVLSFESSDDGLPKVVRDYRARYRAISQVLDDNREILSAVHKDLLKLSEGGAEGREGDYTSENILRALIVQHLEGLPFREAVIRIGSDPFLGGLLADAKAGRDGLLVPGQVLSRYPAADVATGQRTAWPVWNCGRNGQHQRHPHRHDRGGIQHPLSHRCVASVDTWRVASRLLTQAREIFSESCPHRFHDRKIKRLYLYVTCYMPSKSESRQRKVKAAFRTLIERTGWIVAIAGEFRVQAASRENSALVAIALELKAYLPSMKKIVTTASAPRSRVKQCRLRIGCSASSSSTPN